MKTALLWTVVFAAICSSGRIQHSSVEQRVVELPPGNPNTTLDTAAQIGKALVASGFGADIQKRFPSLSQQHLQGLYLTWNAGNFQGKQSVFFLTGIRYSGALPEAKALVMEYETSIPIANMAALRKEVDWIWEAIRMDVEDAKLTNGVVRAVHPEGSGLVTQSKGYGFVFTKRDDGKWHCLQDEKK